MRVTSAAEPHGRRGIARLLDALREHGFAVGTSEAIDATRLLVMLQQKDPEAMTSARLCARLRPVFCKTREQQEQFDSIFREWYGVAEPAPLLEEVSVQQAPVPPSEPPKPKWRTWTILGFLIIGGAIAAFVYINRPEPIPVVTPTPVPTPVPTPTPTPVEPVAPFATPAPETAPILGYFPRIRYNDELRPVWLWILAALPLIALAGFSVPAMVIARTRSRRRREPMYLERGPLEEEARRIVPPLRPEISGKLARHLRAVPESGALVTRRPLLDVRATLEHTLRNRGVPTPRYRNTNAPPSYLLLIDVANQKDPRGRLFYQWAERLQRERLDVEIALVRLHDGEPQFAPAERGKPAAGEQKWTSLARLPRPTFGQRLLLISTGEPLAEADGTWRAEAVAARLHRWRERAMFTPLEPRDWGAREDAIERSEHTADPGFLVLPLDENALAAWTDLLTTGQLSDVVLSEPQRYPALLRRGKGGDLASQETAPDPERLEKLIGQLRVYLGELGFNWLAALAIPPLVRWELTVLLGRDVIQRLTTLKRKDVDAALARNYRRLVRLPWLRFESMPDWLRLRLLAELSPEVQGELRSAVENLLGKLSPTPEADGIALDFERPPGLGATGTAPSAPKESDPLYLGYMSGLTPHQLAMRVPQTWGKWLGKMRFPRRPGLRGWLAGSTDRARSWWARRVFLGGLPFSGLRRAPVGWAVAFVFLAAAFLTLVATKERSWWPESMQPWLFEERAHAVVFHHAGPVRAAVFSPDGSMVLTAGDDGIARVWDVKSGAPVGPPLRHDGPVRAAVFSPRGSVVATARGNSARVWDARTGMPRSRWIDAGGPIGRLAFVGANLATVIGDIVRVWTPSGEPAAKLSLPNVDFEDNRRFALRGIPPSPFPFEQYWLTFNDRAARVWNVDFDDSAKEIARFTHDAPVVSAEFKPTPEPSLTMSGLIEVVTASTDGAARVWILPGPKPLLVLRHGPAVTSASYSSDGRRIVTASVDRTARVWNARTGRALGSSLRHEGAVTSATFSADGMRIVTASADGTARIWEAVSDPARMPQLQQLTPDSSPAATLRGRADRALHAAAIDSASLTIVGSAIGACVLVLLLLAWRRRKQLERLAVAHGAEVTA